MSRKPVPDAPAEPAPATEEMRGRGQPEWQPTEKDRGKVEAWTQAGYGQKVIAERLGVDEKTLRLHCRQELDYGKMDLISGAVRQLGRLALGAPAQFDGAGNKLREEIVPTLGAICFLLKTQGKKQGWTERIEHSGPDGGAITHAGLLLDPEKLKDLNGDELKILERVVGRVFGSAGSDPSGNDAPGDADTYARTLGPDQGTMAT